MADGESPVAITDSAAGGPDVSDMSSMSPLSPTVPSHTRINLTVRVVARCAPWPIKRLLLVGGAPELGDWQIHTGLPLKQDVSGAEAAVLAGCEPDMALAKLYEDAPTQPPTVWIGSVSLRANSDRLEYKYVAESHSGEHIWTVGDNKQLVLTQALEAAVPDTPDGTSSSAEVSLDDVWTVVPDDGTGVVAIDPWLKEFMPALQHRFRKFKHTLHEIDAHGGGLDNFTQGYNMYGFNRVPGKDGRRPGIMFREWAPAAVEISVVGDFNGWNDRAHICGKNQYGQFEYFFEDHPDGTSVIPHRSYVKLSVLLADGSRVLRVPAWIRYALLNPAEATYCGVYWCPPEHERHVWRNERPGSVSHVRADGKAAEHASRESGYTGMRVYEAHVGMASQEGRIATYSHFTHHVLPRIKKLGYNCVQLMAIMEHAYYASFGYHVTNFFAVSSRFGTPEELKELIDTAHGMGLLVICDLVHSHASKNVNDGLNMFDGTDHHYFHGGGKGFHDLWDSRLFDYGKFEVQRFLLSNVRWFVDEYRFDGYRFDGVTSMLYVHHGIGTGFSGGYHEYFGDKTDEDACVYLMLANYVLHGGIPLTKAKPVVTIAEDVSGMPALGRPVDEGGLGFDFRLGMAIPDVWIKLLKEVPDDDWSMGNIVHTLLNRRYTESTITYAESHDQALVGDKTIAFRLMDKEMYDGMSVLFPMSPIVDRGIALHKVIRAITFALGGEGYLNFMGNEFGHPEWIDFPRAGNGESFHHCRRQWHLVDDPLLRYAHLNNFDAALMALDDKYRILQHSHKYVSLKDEGRKLIIVETAGVIFVFNFHPTASFADLMVGTPVPGCYRIVLNSDDGRFGGHSRVDNNGRHFTAPGEVDGRPHSFKMYSPSRTVIAFALADE